LTAHVIGAALLTLAAVFLLAKAARWCRSKWFLMWLVYYFIGLTWNGKHHEGRLTRPELIACRLGTLAVFALVMLGMLYDVTATERFLMRLSLDAVALTLMFAGALAWQWRHYRRWLRPLHLAAHQLAEIPRGRSPAPWSVNPWLRIDRDRTHVTAALPAGWPADEKDKQRLVAIIVAKTGIPNPCPSWHLAGPKPMLELNSAEPPPAKVPLVNARPYIERARSDEIVWGLGRGGVPVVTSLSGDSPHAGLSMGSGAGKSIAARAFLAQMLYRGCIGMILDYKMISHQWARDLPNVMIYRRPREIHDALCWLGGDPTRDITGEAHRRNEVALAGADMDGNVHAVVGPRLIVVCEELNATMSMLRGHWRQQRNDDRSLPQRSPALDALDAVNLMGRQVLLNLLYMGQRLSVKAIGGDGDARESIGVIAFGRFKESNWKMLAGDFPIPAKNLTPGRIQVVTDKVQECQGVFMTAAQARELALAGEVSPLPHDMPGTRAVPGGTRPAISGAEQAFVPGNEPIVPALPELVTLKEAHRDEIVSCSWEALKKASQPKRQLVSGTPFPKDRGHRGLAKLYDPQELAEWDAVR